MQIVEEIQRVQVLSQYASAAFAERGPPTSTPPEVLGTPGEVLGSSEGKSDPSMQDVKDEGKGKGKQVQEDSAEARRKNALEFAFPTPRLFSSGCFDENALFSGNLDSATPSMSSGNFNTADPLSIKTGPPTPLGGIHYVELGERYVFICGEEGLRVFSRYGGEAHPDSSSTSTPQNPTISSTQPGQLVLRIPSDKISYSRWSVKLTEDCYRWHWDAEVVRQGLEWDARVEGLEEEAANSVSLAEHLSPGNMWGRRARRIRLEDGTVAVAFRRPRPGEGAEEGRSEEAKRRRRMYDEFLAVHVSPDQKHFVALLSSSRVLFVPWFERVVRGERSVWDVAVDLQCGSVKAQSVYLSYGVGESGSGGCG